MVHPHIFNVTIYYEDTDVTGLVYHPNYFKYFERARTEYFGGERLHQAEYHEKTSVAVYRADIVFKKGAVLGDKLEIHSTPHIEGEYRVVFKQDARLAKDQTLLVRATVELVCIYQEKLAKVPAWIHEAVAIHSERTQ